MHLSTSLSDRCTRVWKKFSKTMITKEVGKVTEFAGKTSIDVSKKRPFLRRAEAKSIMSLIFTLWGPSVQLGRFVNWQSGSCHPDVVFRIQRRTVWDWLLWVWIWVLCFRRRRHFLKQTLIDPPVNTLHRAALASDAVELIETNGRQPQSEPIHLCRAGGGRQADRKKTKRIALPPRNKWKTRRNCSNV